MAQKECLGRNAFFLLFHFCIEKCSYATSGAGTAQFLFDIRILITPMVSSNFSLKGVNRSRTFKDSQKKANEKTNYRQQNTS
jgi:hypothetical protein